MTRPHAGLFATHNTVPVEFLHLVRSLDEGREEWLIRPLFVVAVNRVVTFRPGDRLILLHSKHP
jgi:hypothetical protein